MEAPARGRTRASGLTPCPSCRNQSSPPDWGSSCWTAAWQLQQPGCSCSQPLPTWPWGAYPTSPLATSSMGTLTHAPRTLLRPQQNLQHGAFHCIIVGLLPLQQELQPEGCSGAAGPAGAGLGLSPAPGEVPGQSQGPGFPVQLGTVQLSAVTSPSPASPQAGPCLCCEPRPFTAPWVKLGGWLLPRLWQGMGSGARSREPRCLGPASTPSAALQPRQQPAWAMLCFPTAYACAGPGDAAFLSEYMTGPMGQEDPWLLVRLGGSLP